VSLSIDGAAAHDLGGAGAREWLEADGLGGWAMGTVAGPRTRRYHGLLCIATRPPIGRVMLVNGLGETFFDGHAARPLDAHYYSGVVHPTGHTALDGFAIEPWPTWTYALDGGQLVREVVVLRGRPGAVVRWRWLPRSHHPGALATLTVRPLCSGRDAHALHHENTTLDPRCQIEQKIGDGCVEVSPYPGAIPGVRLQHDGGFRVAADWYRRFVYPLERERGLDCEEDLFSPGELSFDLLRGPAHLWLAPASEPRIDLASASALLEQEAARRRARVPWARDTTGPAPDPIAARLTAAAEAFVVTAKGRVDRGGTAHATVIAGYPWFTDWGRDTFISARGLGLAFGPRVERDLLLAWEPFVSAGMIPNRFPEGAHGAEGAEYNAVDASLWYALRCARHLIAHAAPLGPDDTDARRRLGSAVQRILEGYLAGTRHGIHVDDDGLVHAADGGLQLTWMDAKVGQWVVTPRAGKPVEVQALWITALEAAARLLGASEPTLGHELAERAAWARSSFVMRFWCEARGYLYDVIDGPARDETLRPNQLYALGLTRPLVDPDRARRALEAVERELLVPVGLRSRARGPGYRGKMVGNPVERDGAYHEGTAWAFLLGIYADACQRVRGRVPPGVLSGLIAHLEGDGLGQIAEVFDGDAPHHPRGCPAQAWSVAEALRVRLGAIAED
jgi:predicted glycogen debranching enzyme